MRGTLTWKVIAAALIFFILSVITMAFSIVNILIIRTAVVHVSNDTVNQVQLSGEFNTDMFRGMAEALFYARYRQAENRASALTEMSDSKIILDKLDVLESKADPYATDIYAERVQLQARRTALHANTEPKVQDVLRAVDANDDAALEQALDALNAHKSQVEQFEEDSGDLAERSVDAAQSAVNIRIQNALISTVLSFGVFVLLLLLTLFMLRRWIVQPIKSLSVATSTVADGRFDQVVRVTNNDEIGHLQQTFNTMLCNLQTQRTALEQRSIALARASSEAQEARTAAEQASTLKSQFLANMSHELRTPLNSIINFTRILSTGMRGPVNAAQLDYLDRVRMSGEHLLGLINDILDLSKIESGRMELYSEPVQIGDIIQGVMSTGAGLIKDKPIELLQEVAPSLPVITADRTRLRQILLNLLSNAAKFTDSGSITMKAWRQGEQLLVSVTDTGIGIAPEHLATVFEEFRQIEGHTNRRYEGTGLGLAICQKLIELHGGRIWLESALGVGSTFTFSLPMLPEAPMLSLGATLLADSARDGAAVLVIDDDPSAIDIVAAYLGQDGYAVYGVNDSRRAIDEARRLQPVAIILDVLMPHKDGWEVLAQLKDDPDLHSVPVVLFSIVEEQKLGFYLGASAYLTKPLDADALRATVAQLVTSDATVLVIDDDPDACEIVAHQLAQAKAYRIVTARGGQAGLDRIAVALPDVIILDLMMPEVDGFTVLDILDRQPHTRSIPVIVLTAKDLSIQERDLLHQRVHGLLAKGQLSQTQLLDKVRTLVKTVVKSAT